MAISNQERVSKALDLLSKGLRPFVEREMKAALGEGWKETIRQGTRDPRTLERLDSDVHVLLGIMWDHWDSVFKKTLGRAERSLVNELRDVRNKWAHQEAFTLDDAYRALDSAARLLAAVSAPEADEIEKQKQELLRVRYEEQARRETRRAASIPIEGSPVGNLKPWREIVTPHPDVASGRYQQAEFAADLWQVYLKEGADEYRDPGEFYRRTFLTDGLRELLTGALRRLAGTGGDPVVELQTNFGGGKTHSMLALYHLFSGAPASDLPGIEAALSESGVGAPPAVRRAVLVGTKIPPGQPQRKKDGTLARTLWGELAWQLGGKEGYALVRQADETATNPGDLLRQLFNRYAPCLVLIDEWVAYARQIYHVSDLPAGTFDTHFTFAQALTEAAKAAPKTLLVVSIPVSDNEIGGEGGRAALEKLKNAVGRVHSPWRPATAEEGFEIVRRRLFQPIIDPNLFVARDAVVSAFSDFYRTQAQEFPAECREASYKRRLTGAYPIHPELFDRLYNDWSSLDRFQQTRGVLRLMAAVIHSLWEREDKSLLILPASVPVDDPPVQSELTRYLEDQWIPAIQKDVDGPHSLPLQVDRDNPNLGRYSACRRVARTIYLGSAPTVRAAHRGLEDRQVKLGCAQPGENVATFGDAMRRLSDAATYLYVDKGRYWYMPQPSVTQLARDRAQQFPADDVNEELLRRLREQARIKGDFAKVHPLSKPGEVPDDPEVRLVLLGPEYPHAAKETATGNGLALKAAAAILDSRGTAPRTCRNALVFLAADKTRLADLQQAVRQYLAWKSIEAERETLNLDAFQANQAKTKRESADETVDLRLQETYQWLLAPGQPQPNSSVEWEEIRLQGQEALAVRAAKKLRDKELLLTRFSGTRLRLELDRIPLWRGDHVSLKQLAEDFSQYLYLPRLKDADVLLDAVKEGVALFTWEQETFAYADGWDSEKQRYRALRAGQQVQAAISSKSLVVKPDVAAGQIAKEAVPKPAAAVAGTAGTPVAGEAGTAVGPATGVAPPAVTAPPQPHRFHGSVQLDATRLTRDAGKIADEVVQHLGKLVRSKIELTLEIQAEIPEGAPDDVVRTVTENCRTLKFQSYGFEEE